MKKLLPLLLIIIAIGCGPVEEDKTMPFYELIYGSTVKAHYDELTFQKKLEELLSRPETDSAFNDPELIKLLNDSNEAIVMRLQNILLELANIPSDKSYTDIKTTTVMILGFQKSFHKNNVSLLLKSIQNGTFGTDSIPLKAYNEAYQIQVKKYEEWQLIRDSYIASLNLSDAELLEMKNKYGCD